MEVEAQVVSVANLTFSQEVEAMVDQDLASDKLMTFLGNFSVAEIPLLTFSTMILVFQECREVVLDAKVGEVNNGKIIEILLDSLA